MALIRWRRESLSLKNVAQVAAAVGADDFSPHRTKASVLMSSHCARDAVEIRRPAAARVELVSGFVERRIAGSAGVDALLGVVLVKLSSAGGFSALFSENSELSYGNVLVT
jgi:hypothetical protein